MTPEERKGDLKELELLEEIHNTEEEIDLFLKQKELEAQQVLEDARRQAQEVRTEAERDALRELDHRKKSLILEAEQEAGRIIAGGTENVRREREAFENKRSQIVHEILDHLLGGEK
ncbi:MAG: hypothetical protein RRA32_06290 [bacterium]|nr:hypothetical protein [bacterium]MDT8396038.1 hypothetical protein [bacterium]